MVLLAGIIFALAAGLVWPFFNYIFSGILSLMVNPLENNDQLNDYCLYMEMIAVLAGVSTMSYQFAFNVSS